jgi:hypothetical protein
MLRNSPIPSATNATTSNDMLDRAFQKTYGLKLKDLFRTLDLSLGTYRYSVSTMLPNVTKIAWSLKSKEIQTRAHGGAKHFRSSSSTTVPPASSPSSAIRPTASLSWDDLEISNMFG